MPPPRLRWAVIFFLAALLLACGSETDLHGVWTGKYTFWGEVDRVTLTLHEDGQYVGHLALPGEEPSSRSGLAGRWRRDGDVIHLTEEPFSTGFGWRARVVRGAIQVQIPYAEMDPSEGSSTEADYRWTEWIPLTRHGEKP